MSTIDGGCLSLNDERRDGVILTHVELGNITDEPQTFDVLLTRDGEIIHWTQHELDAGGEEVLAIDAQKAHGRVEVLVRVNDNWDRTDFDDEIYDGERVIAVVTYGMVEDEALRIRRVIADRPTATSD